MSIRFCKLVIALALGALICLPGVAGAATISYSSSITGDGGAGNWDFTLVKGNNKYWYQPIFQDYGDPADNPPYAINLAQFNSSLGTLNSVTLSLTREIDSSAYCQATNPPTTFKYWVADRAQWVIDPSMLGNFSFDFTNYPNATAITDKNLHTFTKNQTDNSPSNLFTSGLTPFIGTGTLTTELYDATAVSLGFGNGRMGSTFTFSADATVTYDYTPVPLPPSALLLGTGILGLVVLRWRRKSST